MRWPTLVLLGFYMSLLVINISQARENSTTENAARNVDSGDDLTPEKTSLRGEDNCPDQDTIQCGFSVIREKANDRKDGVKSKDHAWPWVVSIQDQEDKKHLCAGVIIEREWVMTAAHCLDETYDPDDFIILAGTNDMAAGTNLESAQVKKVKKIVQYPEFEIPGSTPDLALLKVKTPFCFNDFVRPICFTGSNFPEDTHCVLAGWNMLEELYEKLYEVEVPLISYETCSSGEYYGKTMKEFEFCAGYAADGRGSCQGDTGGPLNCVVNGCYVLQGIVSRGLGCTREQKPGIFTDTTSDDVIKWIEKTTGNSIPLKIMAEMMPDGMVRPMPSEEESEDNSKGKSWFFGIF